MHHLLAHCSSTIIPTMMLLTSSRSFFLLSTILYLALPIWLESVVGAADSANDSKKYVTCGSAIKLKHVQSGGNFLLYSENARNQGGGSGQQIVTFSKDHLNSDKTLWWIHGASDSNCTTSQPIRCGDVIRLSHVSTKRNLHTHNVVSSLSRQQEVTAWGEDYQGDGGDDWIVTCSTEHWERSRNIKLLHRDTRRYLGAADNVKYHEGNCGAECPLMNHLEAFGRKAADEYGDFQVESGLFVGG